MTDVSGFFRHALPPVSVLTLEELHALIHDVLLTRYDGELEQESAAQGQIEGYQVDEAGRDQTGEHRTGLEVPGPTYESNVQLFRQWDQKEVAYMQLLRFIRISTPDPTAAVVSKPGKHHLLWAAYAPSKRQDQELMSVDESYNILSEPRLRFASTITTMDGPA